MSHHVRHRKRSDRDLYFRSRRDKVRRDGMILGPCGKVCHADRGEAKRHAKNLVQLDTSPKPGVPRPYWCQWCDAWHVGHPDPRKGDSRA